MVSFWGKRIKNTSGIANKIGVDEEKIKELKSGKRDIEGETFNKVLEVVEEENTRRDITNMEILQWYRDTDLKALREKYGYKNQTEVARILGCNSSTICNFEKKKPGFVKDVTPRLEQLYYFYKNGFNKKIESKREIAIKESNRKSEVFSWYNKSNIRSYRLLDGVTLKDRAKEIGIPTSSLNDLENRRIRRYTNNMEIVYNYYKNIENDEEKNKEIWNWYINTDIRELRIKEGLKQGELAKRIGASQPCVGDVEGHRTKSVSSTMRALYGYFNKNKKVENNQDVKENNQDNQDKIYQWYIDTKDLRDYGRKFGYSKNKLMKN